jgi:hypothetical protein
MVPTIDATFVQDDNPEKIIPGNGCDNVLCVMCYVTLSIDEPLSVRTVQGTRITNPANDGGSVSPGAPLLCLDWRSGEIHTCWLIQLRPCRFLYNNTTRFTWSGPEGVLGWTEIRA